MGKVTRATTCSRAVLALVLGLGMANAAIAADPPPLQIQPRSERAAAPSVQDLPGLGPGRYAYADADAEDWVTYFGLPDRLGPDASGHARGWVIGVYRKPDVLQDGAEIAFIAMQLDYDCRAREGREVMTVFHRRDQSEYARLAGPAEASAVEPDSPRDMLFKVVCQGVPPGGAMLDGLGAMYADAQKRLGE